MSFSSHQTTRSTFIFTKKFNAWSHCTGICRKHFNNSQDQWLTLAWSPPSGITNRKQQIHVVSVCSCCTANFTWDLALFSAVNKTCRHVTFTWLGVSPCLSLAQCESNVVATQRTSYLSNVGSEAHPVKKWRSPSTRHVRILTRQIYAAKKCLTIRK